MELANLAYAGLVIGQLIDGDFDVGIAVFGLVMLAGLRHRAYCPEGG